jgi:hypothetical protein
MKPNGFHTFKASHVLIQVSFLSSREMVTDFAVGISCRLPVNWHKKLL